MEEPTQFPVGVIVCCCLLAFVEIQSAAAAGREGVMLRLLELCHGEAASAAPGCSLLHLITECGGSTKAMDAAAKAAALRQPVDAKAKRPGLEDWTPLVGFTAIVLSKGRSKNRPGESGNTKRLRFCSFCTCLFG